MADIILHPAVHAQLQARLAEVEAILAEIDKGLPSLMANPQYRASTAINARRDGLTIEEMHRRGIQGARSHFEEEQREIQRKLMGYGAPIAGLTMKEDLCR